MDLTLKSYDGNMVKVPEEMKDKYLRSQDKIKRYLEQGKTKEEIKKLLKKEK